MMTRQRQALRGMDIAAKALERSTGAVATLDCSTGAGHDVRRVAYLIHQTFRFEHLEPGHGLRHRLLLIPPERHGGQRLIAHRLEISSPTTEVRREQDTFGNLVLSLAADTVARAIDLTAWIVVERDALGEPVTIPPWTYANPLLREPSRLTKPDNALRCVADTLQVQGQAQAGGHALAARINAWVHAEMHYIPAATGVETTAVEALAQRRGGCQDFAHVMLALCRLSGLPARYVSGHLHAESGSHAWVEVLVPDPENPARYLARPFDPSNGTEPGLEYVTVAVGRDDADVAPTSGTYCAPYTGNLSTRKSTAVMAIDDLPVLA